MIIKHEHWMIISIKFHSNILPKIKYDWASFILIIYHSCTSKTKSLIKTIKGAKTPPYASLRGRGLRSYFCSITNHFHLNNDLISSLLVISPSFPCNSFWSSPFDKLKSKNMNNIITKKIITIICIMYHLLSIITKREEPNLLSFTF